MKGMGMRHTFTDNRVLTKADILFTHSGPQFVHFQEFDDCHEGQIMISIEHWYNKNILTFLFCIAQIVTHIPLPQNIMNKSTKHMQAAYREQLKSAILG